MKIFYIQTIYISVDHCPPKQMRMEMGESCCTGHFKFLASELTLATEHHWDAAECSHPLPPPLSLKETYHSLTHFAWPQTWLPPP